MSMDKSRLNSLFKKLEHDKVLVFGDLMIDEFLYGEVSRISPEAPVPILRYNLHSTVLGGAANAAANIAALGGKPYLVGCIGQDDSGDQLVNELTSSGFSGEGIVVDSDRQTTKKTRIIADTQHIVRIDKEDKKDISEKIAKLVEKKLEVGIKSAGAVLISDYQKGTVHKRVVANLIDAAKESSLPVVVDTKAVAVDAFNGATILTPNVDELKRISNIDIIDLKSLTEASSWLLDAANAEAVLVTRAEHGMTLFSRDKTSRHFPAHSVEVSDVTGAGDTVASTIALSLAVGLSFEEAITIANYAAAVVVRKVGTAVASPDEILHFAEGDS